MSSAVLSSWKDLSCALNSSINFRAEHWTRCYQIIPIKTPHLLFVYHSERRWGFTGSVWFVGVTNWDCQVWKKPKQTNLLCSSHLLFRLEGAAQHNEMFLCPSCTIIKVWGRVNYWVKFDFTCWTAEAKHSTEAHFLCGCFRWHGGGLTCSQTS